MKEENLPADLGNWVKVIKSGDGCFEISCGSAVCSMHELKYFCEELKKTFIDVKQKKINSKKENGYLG